MLKKLSSLFPQEQDIPQKLRHLKSFQLLSRLLKSQPTPLKTFDNIQLYDKQNIDQLPWSTHSEGELLRDFFVPLIKEGVHHYVPNMQADIQILRINQMILPLTVTDHQENNCYVCSPYNYYVSYGKQSLSTTLHPLFNLFFKGLFHALGSFFRFCQLDRVVIVNNWMFATNLYPSLDPRLMEHVSTFLKQRFPKHAILFRSIDQSLTPSYFHALKDNGYALIANRQIFFTDTVHQPEVFETRVFRSDLKLLQTKGYTSEEIHNPTSEEWDRILELYHGIYIQKHSAYNPQFNEQFLKLALKNGVLRFKVLKKEGQIDAAVGYIRCNGIMTTPFFGYDHTKQEGLYRMLSTVAMLEAKQNKLILHQSAGASMFKKIRKAQSCLEYLAVYHRHLSWRRKLPWLLLKPLSNSIGAWFMQRY